MTDLSGSRKGLYPIILFHRSNVTMYCRVRPSRFRRGHMLSRLSTPRKIELIIIITHLKTATLLARTPHANRLESGEDPDRRRFIGSRGTRIVFSCTWKENRKNDIDEESNA
jgi:hypothetical protein